MSGGPPPPSSSTEDLFSTVCLEPGEATIQIFNSAQASPQTAKNVAQILIQAPKEDGPSDIRHYFQSLEPSSTDKKESDPSSFFDTLSSSTPMMKSVPDISALPGAADDTLNSSVTTTTNSTATIQFTIGESDPPPPAEFKELSDQNPAPPLFKLFTEEHGGGDTEGKAFFDTIANAKLHLPLEAMETLSENMAFSHNPPKSPSLTPSPLLQAPPHLESDCSDYASLWIPSLKTQQILERVSQKTYVLDKNDLTLARLQVSDTLKDPLAQALIDHELLDVTSQSLPNRKCLTADSVSQDATGIKYLISAGSYHAAANLIGRLLTLLGQGVSAGHAVEHTPFTLQLWFTRLALLIKLRLFELAEAEAEPFGDLDQPDLYYQFYEDRQGHPKNGSMVSFSFRLLLAELPHHSGANHHLAMNRLCFLLDRIKLIKEYISQNIAKPSQAAALALWQKRENQVLYSLFNCAHAIKDFGMCLTLLDQLKASDPHKLRQIESAIGRIYLQFGDVTQAKEHFKLAAGAIQETDVIAQVEILINSALLAVAKDGYTKAYNLFKEAYELQPENKMLANNMAVCLLYSGQLREALKLLETTGRSSGHEGVLFNTCTLFELQSSHNIAQKKAMLAALAPHVPDTFNPACLKLPSNVSG